MEDVLRIRGQTASVAISVPAALRNLWRRGQAGWVYGGDSRVAGKVRTGKNEHQSWSS